jgi:hypothetical protein
MGEIKIPILIYVSGHVSPKIYKEIKDWTKINYYSGDKEYTKIEINSKSNLFVEDLWISRFAPLEILLADFILINPIIFLLIVFALLSCMASIFSGLIVFGRNISFKKFSLLGLSNFLTLIGLTILTYMTVKEKKKGIGKLTIRTFYSFLVLMTLLFIFGFILQLWVFLILAIFIFLLSIAMGIWILATITPKKFVFVVVFSFIFLLLIGLFYSFMVVAYPYKKVEGGVTVLSIDNVYCEPAGGNITVWLRNDGIVTSGIITATFVSGPNTPTCPSPFLLPLEPGTIRSNSCTRPSSATGVYMIRFTAPGAVPITATIYCVS